MLTSAFPYAQKVHLLPKPMTLHENKDTPEKETTEARKKIKKLQFVSAPLFQQIISGHMPAFVENKPITINGEEVCLINGERVWVTTKERDQLKNLTDEDIGGDENLYVWRTATRPRVTLGSLNAGSEIWHVQTVQFNTDCGLWFAAHFNGDDQTQQKKIETLLRVLGDSGIGGERNAGYGQFEFDKTEFEIPSAQDNTQFLTLSPMCPKSPEQLEHLLKGDIAYNLNPLTGWVSSTGMQEKRKTVNMFAEGSVLNDHDEPIGRLVDLTPKDSPHPVYRYGYAWQVGIKGTENATEIQT